jgi:hypothetical protein
MFEQRAAKISGWRLAITKATVRATMDRSEHLTKIRGTIRWESTPAFRPWVGDVSRSALAFSPASPVEQAAFLRNFA